MAEKVVTVSRFRGLNDFAVPEEDPSVTRDLNGVFVRNGRLFGAPGITKYGNVSSAASTNIIKLMPFYTTTLAPVLYRMLPTAVEQYNPIPHTWTDVTGIALTGFIYTQPQFVVHKDTLVFTNRLDRPRMLLGDGSNSVVLGGIPPYAGCIWQAWGFLFLGDISDDGVTFFPRRVRYTDDFTVNWDLCNGNELNFNETSGSLVCGGPVGEVVVLGKTDAIMQLRFDGGLVRFGQDRLPFSNGVLSAATFKVLDGIGAVFLATDHRLQFCNGYKVETVPPYVQKKLDDTMDPEEAEWSFGENYPDKDTYSLWYQALSGTTNRILMNFRTGEFSHRIYENHVLLTSALIRRGSQNRLLEASGSLVYEEADTYPTDDGKSFDRYYTIDWTDLGVPGEKLLMGVELQAAKKFTGRLSISVAVDNKSDYQFEKFYSLKNMPRVGEFVKIIYRIDPGIKGRDHKVRIRLFHDDAGEAVEVIPPLRIFYEMPAEVDMDSSNVARASDSRG